MSTNLNFWQQQASGGKPGLAMIGPADRALTQAETERLAGLEKRIEAGMETFLQVAEDLLKIKAEELYRYKWDSFEAYCRERWNMTPRRARQIVAGAEVVDNLRNHGSSVLPSNERQVRALAGLPVEQQMATWNKAVEQRGGKPTGKVVEEIAEGRKQKEEISRASDSARGSGTLKDNPQTKGASDQKSNNQESIGLESPPERTSYDAGGEVRRGEKGEGRREIQFLNRSQVGELRIVALAAQKQLCRLFDLLEGKSPGWRNDLQEPRATLARFVAVINEVFFHKTLCPKGKEERRRAGRAPDASRAGEVWVLYTAGSKGPLWWNGSAGFVKDLTKARTFSDRKEALEKAKLHGASVLGQKRAFAMAQSSWGKASR